MTTATHPRNPAPTVDIVILAAGLGIVLVERKNPPPGWALPGGFVDYGESCEAAAVREAREETGLDVVLTGLVGVYSDPARDPRGHTMGNRGRQDTVEAADEAGQAGQADESA